MKTRCKICLIKKKIGSYFNLNIFAQFCNNSFCYLKKHEFITNIYIFVSLLCLPWYLPTLSLKSNLHLEKQHQHKVNDFENDSLHKHCHCLLFMGKWIGTTSLTLAYSFPFAQECLV